LPQRSRRCRSVRRELAEIGGDPRGSGELGVRGEAIGAGDLRATGPGSPCEEPAVARVEQARIVWKAGGGGGWSSVARSRHAVGRDEAATAGRFGDVKAGAPVLRERLRRRSGWVESRRDQECLPRRSASEAGVLRGSRRETDARHGDGRRRCVRRPRTGSTPFKTVEAHADQGHGLGSLWSGGVKGRTGARLCAGRGGSEVTMSGSWRVFSA
jgi:hypothetical protein